jgi:hypothetical protein
MILNVPWNNPFLPYPRLESGGSQQPAAPSGALLSKANDW